MHPPHQSLVPARPPSPPLHKRKLHPPPHISEKEEGRRCRADDGGSLPLLSRCCTADKVGRQRSSPLDASATEPSAPAPMREERPSPASSSAPQIMPSPQPPASSAPSQRPHSLSSRGLLDEAKSRRRRHHIWLLTHKTPLCMDFDGHQKEDTRGLTLPRWGKERSDEFFIFSSTFFSIMIKS